VVDHGSAWPAYESSLVGRWLIQLTIGNWVEGKFVGLPDIIGCAG